MNPIDGRLKRLEQSLRPRLGIWRPCRIQALGIIDAEGNSRMPVSDPLVEDGVAYCFDTRPEGAPMLVTPRTDERGTAS